MAGLEDAYQLDFWAKRLYNIQLADFGKGSCER
jgi:hypothetical protein